MGNILQECVEQIFTKENLGILWDSRQSQNDIIGLETELPIRYKLNDVGSRNIELKLQSQFGTYYKTIALIENTNILFPREFDELSIGVELADFKKYGMKPELNVMIGAFSMTSLLLAIKGQDVDSYVANNTTFEMLRAFDGTMQTFVKEKGGGFLDWSVANDFYISSLDGVAISAFKFGNGESGVFPTQDTHKLLENFAPQRVFEIFTIEQ